MNGFSHVIERKEWRWVLGVVVIAIVVANAPIMLGFLTAPHGTVYTGIESTAPGDVNVYLSYLEQVRQGHLVFKDLFTGETQTNGFFNLFWLVLGLIGALFHLSPIATYFIARVLLGAGLLFFIYFIASQLFSEIRWRKIAFLLAVFAGGVGALLAPFISAFFHGSAFESAWPMDLWVSEGFTFLSLHHSPHFLAATILILASVMFLAKIVERPSMRTSSLAGVFMLSLYAFHPFHVLSLGAVSVGFLLLAAIRKRQEFFRIFGHFALAWLIAIPAVAYQAWLVLKDPLGSGRADQNILYTPPLLTTIASYGFLGLAAAVGSVKLWKTKLLRNELLVVWGLFHALAIYFPIFFNRRVTQGLNIAFAFLAVAAVVAVINRLGRSMKKSTTAVFAGVVALFLFGMSTLWVTAQDFSFIVGSKGRHFPYYFYLSKDYRDAFQWIRAHGDDFTVVLSAPVTGNFIPGWSGRQVFVGHNVETVKFEEKRKEAVRFYSDEVDDAWRRSFLLANRITHVVVGPWENQFGAFGSSQAPFLTPVFSSASVMVYSVDTSILPSSRGAPTVSYFR